MKALGSALLALSSLSAPSIVPAPPMSPPPEKIWFDAFNGCKKQTQSERDAAFKKEQNHWRQSPETRTTDEVDLWVEPIDPKLPQTVKIERGTLGWAESTLAACKNNQYKLLPISASASDLAIARQNTWYRARLHKNSCELTGLNYDQISSWFVRDIAKTTDAKKCHLKIHNGPLGYALFLNCGDQTEFLADTRTGCEFLLNENKPDFTPEELEQFGWE